MIFHFIRYFTLGACCLCYSLAFFTFAVSASTTNIEVAIDGQYFFEKSHLSSIDYQLNGNVFFGVEHSDTFFDDLIIMNIDGHANYNVEDDNQTLIDFNEFSLNYFADDYTISAGMITDFWGVTESWHLVDVLNQTNVAANIDEETKLGQPMVKVEVYQEWGSLQFYWMPIFRERIFPSEEARLRTELFIDENYAQYESSDRDNHHDFAFRYSHTIDRVDFGIGYFNGTDRTPLLQAQPNDNENYILAPYYWQNERISLDLQITLEALLLKLEVINSKSEVQQTYQAAVSGFEYTQVGLFGGAMDLGYITEYLYDERGELATTPFADDIFLGLRLVANNISQSTYLLGTYVDVNTHHSAWRFEMETRIEDGLTFSIEGQYFSAQDINELLYNFQEDHYLTISIQKFY